ncbi:MAG TPA: hypothetical protein VJV39_04155 [Dongiaceae bacterium]|nr:hypothetical protein [Dongiaceae bacterium]
MASSSPLFCHVHIPKTGGTSLNALLAEWFPLEFEVIHHPDPNFVLTVDELEAHLVRNPGLRCISTHNLRAYPPRIGDRRVHYFTILREPLDRTISVITFLKKTYSELSEEHRMTLPRDFCDMPELDIIRMWTTDLSVERQRPGLLGNPVTALLLGDISAWNLPENRHAREGMVASKCISILSQFLYVGDFGCYEQSVRELARRVRSLNGSLCNVTQVPKQRVSRDARGGLIWLNEGRSAIDAFMAGMAIDGMVYRHFARMNGRLAQQG